MNTKKFSLSGGPGAVFTAVSRARSRQAETMPAYQPGAGLETAETKSRVIVRQIRPEGPGTVTLVLQNSIEEKPLPSFLPGQHISVTALVEGSPVSRPYTLISGPGDAEKGFYEITVRSAGFLSRHLAEHLKVGDTLLCSLPEGRFCVNALRDSGHIVALAGGSGVAAFVSMARAIREGTLNARLTLLYSCPAADGFLHKGLLDSLTGPNVNVQYYCPDDPKNELKPLCAEEIDRAAQGKEYSLFYCGSPETMAGFEVLISKLKTRPKSVRPGEGGCVCPPVEGDRFSLKVKARSIVYSIQANPGETLMTALERSGITPESRCRAGRCGVCRARCISGEYKVAEGFEGGSEAEQEAGWLRLCRSIPTSDMELEIFPADG